MAPQETVPSGAVTLITGASGGICGTLALMLAAGGHRLVLSGLEEDVIAPRSSGASMRRAARRSWEAGDMRDRGMPAALVDRALRLTAGSTTS